ncbi:MAG TPA: heme-copper oxidase subunit III [Chloroflexota bacterium]
MAVNASAQTQAGEVPRLSHAMFGLWVFIAAESLFFGLLIAAYLYLRVRSQVWPPPGTPEKDLLVPIFNSIVLFSSGATMHGAHEAMRRGDTGLARGGILVTVVLGTAFLLGQAFEYVTAGYGLSSSVWGSSFFTLTGFHGSHVLVGLIFLAMVYVKAGRGVYTADHHLGVEAAALYWHFVDAVWVVLFTVLYLL